MTVDNPIISLSPLEEQRFGVKTAKSTTLKKADIPEVMKFCSDNGVEFLIVRCPTFDIGAVQEMENLGFLLMDTLLSFTFDLAKWQIPSDQSDNVVREARPGDERKAMAVAAQCFQGYTGHYHADALLDRAKCDEVYADWAYRACTSASPSSRMFVSVSGDHVTGFGTMHDNDGIEGVGGLFCVSPSARGLNLSRSIIIKCLDWCRERSLGKMTIATQITNHASQKIWARMGFELSESYYTFHKWFTPPGKGGPLRS